MNRAASNSGCMAPNNVTTIHSRGMLNHAANQAVVRDLRLNKVNKTIARLTTAVWINRKM